jgi:hypothetical protein
LPGVRCALDKIISGFVEMITEGPTSHKIIDEDHLIAIVTVAY